MTTEAQRRPLVLGETRRSFCPYASSFYSQLWDQVVNIACTAEGVRICRIPADLLRSAFFCAPLPHRQHRGPRHRIPAGLLRSALSLIPPLPNFHRVCKPPHRQHRGSPPSNTSRLAAKRTFSAPTPPRTFVVSASPLTVNIMVPRHRIPAGLLPNALSLFPPLTVKIVIIAIEYWPACCEVHFPVLPSIRGKSHLLSPFIEAIISYRPIRKVHNLLGQLDKNIQSRTHLFLHLKGARKLQLGGYTTLSGGCYTQLTTVYETLGARKKLHDTRNIIQTRRVGEQQSDTNIQHFCGGNINLRRINDEEKIRSDLDELAVPATAMSSALQTVRAGSPRHEARERPKPNVDPPTLLAPLVFAAAAVQPAGLPDFGDNLAVHTLRPGCSFDNLDAVIHPPLPFSNVWDLKSAQGVHLGLRGKAAADGRACPGVWDTADAGGKEFERRFDAAGCRSGLRDKRRRSQNSIFDNGRADDATGKRKCNGTQRAARHFPAQSQPLGPTPTASGSRPVDPQQCQASQKVATDAVHKTQPNPAPNIGAPPAQQPANTLPVPGAILGVTGAVFGVTDADAVYPAQASQAWTQPALVRVGAVKTKARRGRPPFSPLRRMYTDEFEPSLGAAAVALEPEVPIPSDVFASVAPVEMTGRALRPREGAEASSPGVALVLAAGVVFPSPDPLSPFSAPPSHPTTVALGSSNVPAGVNNRALSGENARRRKKLLKFSSPYSRAPSVCRHSSYPYRPLCSSSRALGPLRSSEGHPLRSSYRDLVLLPRSRLAPNLHLRSAACGLRGSAGMGEGLRPYREKPETAEKPVGRGGQQDYEGKWLEKGEETEWTTRSYTSSGYRNQYPVNDIQGTGAVVLSGFINAARLSSAASGKPLSSHRILFFGAGSAGVGVAMQLMSFFTLEGVSEQEARERIWLVDSQGLVYTTRGELAEHKEYFARRDYAGPPITDLLDILDSVQPTALMGLSTMSGAFSRAAIETRRLERNARSSFSYGYRSREPSTFYQGQANYSAGYQEQSQGYNQMAQQSFQLYEQSRFSQRRAGPFIHGADPIAHVRPPQTDQHLPLYLYLILDHTIRPSYTAAQLSTSNVSADVSASAPAIPATGSTTSEPSTGAVHAFNATDTVDQLRANRRHRRQRRQVHDQWTQQSQASQKVATDAAHKPSDPAPSYGMSPFAHNPVAKTQPNLAPNIGAPPAQQPVASSATPAAPSHTAIVPANTQPSATASQNSNTCRVSSA
ncbi:hypothetical protein B0H14DRAFT_3666393 [Mycena olivaceomarginata]|nr:hypothetical protein B0H14DRAFT_3666393 [Mycena olivaceomarginata]